MIPTAEHIAKVGAKVARLIKAYRTVLKDNERLKEELEKKTSAENTLREQTKLMEQQLKSAESHIRTSGRNGKKRFTKTTQPLY